MTPPGDKKNIIPYVFGIENSSLFSMTIHHNLHSWDIEILSLPWRNASGWCCFLFLSSANLITIWEPTMMLFVFLLILTGGHFSPYIQSLIWLLEVLSWMDGLWIPLQNRRGCMTLHFSVGERTGREVKADMSQVFSVLISDVSLISFFFLNYLQFLMISH